MGRNKFPAQYVKHFKRKEFTHKGSRYFPVRAHLLVIHLLGIYSFVRSYFEEGLCCCFMFKIFYSTLKAVFRNSGVSCVRLFLF